MEAKSLFSLKSTLCRLLSGALLVSIILGGVSLLLTHSTFASSHVQTSSEQAATQVVDPPKWFLEQERQEKKFKELFQRWQIKSEDLERKLDQFSVITTQDYLNYMLQAGKVDRLNTTVEIMGIELNIVEEFIQEGWWETARWYIRQNAKLLNDLEKQVNDIEIQKNISAPLQ